MSEIIWMFSGQGTQYIGMGRALYEQNQHFRENFDLCNEIAQMISGRSFLEVIYLS